MTTINMQRLSELANEARPLDPNECGTERQLAALSAFIDDVEPLMTVSQREALAEYSVGVDQNDVIDEYLRVAKEVLQS